jgi:hypothetical protein
VWSRLNQAADLSFLRAICPSRGAACCFREADARIPIVIFYGDNFPVEPTTERGQDNWRVRLAMAKLWVEAVNKHGGDAKLVNLPEIGIRGNTHFMFSDRNNLEIADQVLKFLGEKNLD